MNQSEKMLSAGEFEIMECVWTCEEAPTQTQIMRWVNEKNNKNLKVATIATYIRRIMWKGYLKKDDTGDGHPTYRAMIDMKSYFVREAEMFRKRWGSNCFLRAAQLPGVDWDGAENQKK